MRRKILWVDCETTGTNPEFHDIWQLAFIIEIDGSIEYKESSLIRPYNFETIQQSALAAGNTSIEELEKIDMPITKTVDRLKSIWGAYIDKYDRDDKFVIAGYNVRFDYNFIYEMFQKAGDQYGLGSWAYWPTRDVATYVADIAILKGFRFDNFQLKTVCGKFGIEFDAHDAMEDIKATKKLYEVLMEIWQAERV